MEYNLLDLFKFLLIYIFKTKVGNSIQTPK